MHPLDRLRSAKVVAVLRSATADDAVRIAEALVDAGVRAIEITYSTPDVAAALRRVCEGVGPDILVGAGTLTDAAHAREAAAAGAQFLVSPHLDLRLLEAMLETGLTALPGILTPTEAIAARAHGAPAVKLFPASSVGPAHLRALRAPFPDLKVVPTGGIGAATAAEWLAAGAWAVGVGGELAPAVLDGADARAALTARAQALLATVE
jgi:2-dehydro-3-deoxyphosphogluconate aldolase/(4S)-4-hydroxy-2-oxoglutarate aldolase